MTDLNDMDKLLSRAKNEAEKFFADYSYERMNKAVYSRIRSETKVNQLKKIYDSSRNHKILSKTKIPAIIACTFFLLISFSALLFRVYSNQEKVNLLGEPVSQEMIKLNESDSGQLLDYFKINKPEQTGDNLLAVIWDSEHEGRYEMAYSSLFEDTNQPGPILMIYFPQNQPGMAVISSENKDLQYIHYRVVGYRKNQIVTLMEQNYINGGEIEVLDGALKESRLVPGYPGKIVTHYIPYQLSKSGDIISSLQNIKINIGEYIAFIGNSSDPVEVSYSDLFSEREYEPTDSSNEYRILYAESSGHEELSIKPVSGGKTKTISVEVVENE
jgi:hypothetical protein